MYGGRVLDRNEESALTATFRIAAFYIQELVQWGFPHFHYSCLFLCWQMNPNVAVLVHLHNCPEGVYIMYIYLIISVYRFITIRWLWNLALTNYTLI